MSVYTENFKRKKHEILINTKQDITKDSARV